MSMTLLIEQETLKFRDALQLKMAPILTEYKVGVTQSSLGSLGNVADNSAVTHSNTCVMNFSQTLRLIHGHSSSHTDLS